MKNKLAIIYLICALALCAFVLRYEIKAVINVLLPPQICEGIYLTTEQKTEDFLSMYDTITSSMLTLDEYKANYGIDFRNKKNEYLQIIKETENDSEFYAAMVAILQDVPSFHTDILYPSEIQQLRCYDSKKYATDRNIISKNRYWKKLLEEVASREKLAYTELQYVDGKYILENDTEWTLEKIDGIEPTEYIKSRVSVFNLHYDGKNKQPYRNSLVFNEHEGTKVTLRLRSKNGRVWHKEVRRSLLMEEVFADLWSAKRQEETEEPQTREYEGFSYIKINNMLEPYGKAVAEILQNTTNTNIVLDLRDNYGGNTDFAAKYIYPYLYASNLETSCTWYMPESQENMNIRKDIFNRFYLGLKETTSFPYTKDTHLYKDEQDRIFEAKMKQKYVGRRKKDKNVILLVGSGTGSAADRFASDMKDAGKAVLIGNNTGGEGRMASYKAACLPNSALVYVYMPGAAKNSDGSDNSAVGTSPDIYATDEAILQECERFFEKT